MGLKLKETCDVSAKAELGQRTGSNGWDNGLDEGMYKVYYALVQLYSVILIGSHTVTTCMCFYHPISFAEHV